MRPVEWMLVASLALAPGCATPCVTNCEAINECPGVVTVDCDITCADSESLADAAGCRAQLDAATQCELDSGDACTARDTCAAAIQTYNDCFDAACVKTPTLCGAE